MIKNDKAGLYTVLRPDFSLDLKNLVKIKSFFGDSIKDVNKGILLDLSHVEEIDSVGYRSINNIFSSLKKKNVGLLLYTDTPEVVDQFKRISPDIKITNNEEEAFQLALKASCTDAFIDVELECPICGNRDFPKRVLSRDSVKFYFEEGHFLPHCLDLITGKPVDIYRSGVIICDDCLLTSFYHTDFFHTIGGTRMPPAFSSDAKHLLIKCTNRRRDILSKIGVEVQGIQAFVKEMVNLEYVYRLCADCVASTSFDRSMNRFFEAGMANLLVYYFMPDNKKEAEFLDKADTAFKECIKNRPEDAIEKVWQSYYYRNIIAVIANKTPASIALLDALRKERDALDDSGRKLLDFWHTQALKVHRQAINEVAIKNSL